MPYKISQPTSTKHPSVEMNRIFRNKEHKEKEIVLPNGQKITLVLEGNYFVKMKTSTGKVVSTSVLSQEQIDFIIPQL
jgi:hypothetical protein